MTQPLEIVLILKNNDRDSTCANRQDSDLHHEQLENCDIRNKMIDWFYGAQDYFESNRTTLFMSASVLDRLIAKNFKLDPQDYELIAATIYLICAKLNQVLPPSFRDINKILNKDQNHDAEEYREMECAILEALDFNIMEENTIYDGFAELEDNYAYRSKEKIENIVQSALTNPSLFRYGTGVLFKAIENYINDITIQISDSFNDPVSKEINIISAELRQIMTTDTRSTTASLF